MDDDKIIAPIVDAPVVEAPAVEEAPVIQADTNVPVGLMIDNNTGEPNVQEEEPADDKDGGVVSVEGSGATDTTDTVEPQAPIQSNETAQAPVAEPATELVDPGEFVPQDYSFEVKLADGSKITISKPEDIEALGADVEFASAADLLKTQASFSRMVSGIEADKKVYDDKKSAYDTAVQANEQQETFIAGLESGMGYLESNGSLPPVPKQYENADWTDPEVAKQPGVKERVAIIEYMASENAKRSRAGVPPINSVLDAYNAMQLADLQKANTARADTAKAATKARGAMVGGESSQSQGATNIPANMIVGPGGNIRDL